MQFSSFTPRSWPLTAWLVTFITFCGAVLRLWNLPNTLMFQGDQGRDALIVSQIFTQGDLVFIGPVTSVGNMYLGPLYYYFMVPFLRLTYPSPLGPAYAVAVLGILTIPLMFYLGRKLVGERAALIGSILMAFSFVAVAHSRFSWNPNPAPLVSLIMIWATYMAWKKSAWYWVGVSICFSILVQLHYLTLLSLGGAGLIWLFHVYETVRSKAGARKNQHLKKLLLATLAAIAVFAVSLTPLALFDYRHDGLNRKAFIELFTQEEILADNNQLSPISKIAETAKETHGRAMHILFEPSFGQHRTINTLMVVAVVAILILALRKPGKHRAGYVTVIAYLSMAIIGTAVYKHTLFDHYILFALPAAYLGLGIVLSWLSRYPWGIVVSGVWLAAFIYFNVSQMSFANNSPTIYDMQQVTDSISSKLEPGELYSLVLLAPSHDLYAQNYRYFLSTGPTPALPPERAGEAETLVVINEETEPVDIPSSSIHEIMIFPEKKPGEVYTIPNGPQIWIFRRPT